MPEQLGKIERLEVEYFRRGKKLYLVPLIYCREDAPDEYKEKYDRYWQQAAEQLARLTSKIGKVNRIYHESIFVSGDEGMKVIERLTPGSYQVAKIHYNDGAVLEAVEEKELLAEVMDWQKCLMLNLTSEKVASRISEFYVEAAKKRNEFMLKKISETLKDNEAGLLFIRENHSLQFPNDIEVFSIFPPVLDEIHRWLRDQARLEAEKVTKETEGETKKTEE